MDERIWSTGRIEEFNMPYGDEKEKLFKAALKYIETPPSRNEKMATILHKQGLKVLPDEKPQKPNRTIPPR